MSRVETLQRKRYGSNSSESIAPVREFFLEVYNSTMESVDTAVDTKNGVRRIYKKSPEFPLVDAFCQKNYQGGDILDLGESFKGLEDPDFYLTTNKDKNIVGTLGIRESETPPELKELNPENKKSFELMRFSYDADLKRKDVVKSTQDLFRRAIDFLCTHTKSGELEDLFFWMMTYKKMTRFFAAANKIKDFFIDTGRSPQSDALPLKCRCFFKKADIGFFLINTENKKLREIFLESRIRQDSLLREELNQKSTSPHGVLSSSSYGGFRR